MPHSPKSFTIVDSGRVDVLISDVLIDTPVEPDKIPSHNFTHRFRAIWDTGATHSVITQKVVDECGIKPFSITTVRHVDGESDAEVYRDSVRLVNGVTFDSLKVTKGNFGSNCAGDVLIGMDVIGRGDFAVTNFQGKTAFTFRTPSIQCRVSKTAT